MIKEGSSWGRRRNAYERSWPVFGVFAIVFEIALIISLFTIVSANQDPKLIDFSAISKGEDYPPSNSLSKDSKQLKADSNKTGICLTQECIRTASGILSALNRSMNPCDDFYNFACGNFIKSTVIPEDQKIVSTFSDVAYKLQLQLKTILSEETSHIEKKPFKNAYSLYKSCMNTPLIEERGILSMQIISESLGGWPTIVGQRWNESLWSWADTIKKIREYGFGTHIIDLSIEADKENSTRNILYLDQPILGLSRKYLLKGLEDRIVKAYYDYMVDLAVLFGAEKSRAEKETLDSLNFEIALANISLSDEERGDKTVLYNVYSVNALQGNYSYVNWMEYILPKELNINKNETVILSSPTFFQQLGPLIERTPKRAIANYLMFIIHEYSASYLNEKIRKRQLEYSKVLNSLQKEKARWKECIDVVSIKLHLSLAALYVRKHLSDEAKANTFEMVNRIRNAIEDLLESNAWMNNQTKEFMLNKIRKITAHIGGPNELLDDSKIEDYYKDLDISSEEYLESILTTNRFFTQKNFMQLRKPYDELDWIKYVVPPSVRAFHNPNDNSINLAAEILQDKFFSVNRPWYLNYGSIGFIIGHEITHGFDEQGRQFDTDGNFINQTDTQDNFKEKVKCIIQQYGNYTDKQMGLKLNSINTKEEDFADNGGIKACYDAYNNWETENGVEQKLPGLNYTSQQMFWISMARTWCTVETAELKTWGLTKSVHSPAEFRILGPLQNMDPFSKDFNCPLGSPMNPVHKCEVW